MKILSIYRSRPEQRITSMVSSVTGVGQPGNESGGKIEVQEIHLYEEKAPDYDSFLKQIFESDRVYSWW